MNFIPKTRERNNIAPFGFQAEADDIPYQQYINIIAFLTGSVKKKRGRGEV